VNAPLDKKGEGCIHEFDRSAIKQAKQNCATILRKISAGTEFRALAKRHATNRYALAAEMEDQQAGNPAHQR